MNFRIFSQKVAFFAQTAAIFFHNIGFFRKRQFFSPKIVIITSTPGLWVECHHDFDSTEEDALLFEAGRRKCFHTLTAVYKAIFRVQATVAVICW
jgi:hypothetical protein